MKCRYLFVVFVSVFFFLGVDFSSAAAREVYQVHTRVELISEQESIQPGMPFWVGLRMKTDPDWHTYWRNPGDSGAATTIKWDLPQGFSASEIHWAYPKQFEQQGIASYGYAREMVLLTKITPPKDIAQDQIALNAQVDWLACEVPCLPGAAQLSLTLPVGDQGHVPRFSQWRSLFDQARWELPQKLPDWTLEAYQDAKKIVLNFNIPSIHEITQAQFFPYESMVILHAAPQEVRQLNDGSLELTLVKDLRGGPNMIDQLQGAAVMNGASSANPVVLDIDIPVDAAGPTSAMQTTASARVDKLVMLVFAFVGGIVLNLMPCFFPVLSIKVMHYVGQSGDRKHALVNALGYASGIVATFLVLAVVLIVLRAGGDQLGWGFQFQSPFFVTAMALVLFVIALNFFGVFEVSGPSGVSMKAASGQGLGAAFASGILAVIVATPCAAPFMGAAVSFALTQSVMMNLAIFIFLGLGLAFPFVLLCMIPKLVDALPRPGPWMEYFKKSLGFVMLALVLWLLWVLSAQKEANALVMVLFSMLVLSLGLWMWGLAFQSVKRPRWKIALAVLLIAAGVAFPLFSLDTFGQQGGHQMEQSSSWIPYDAEQLAQWEQEGKTIFVDFYARWCLTCQVNQKVALDQPSVIQYFNERDVVMVKADWTNKDPAITEALERFGRATLPTYVVLYGSPDDRQEKILPKLLTPGIVKKAVDSVN